MSFAPKQDWKAYAAQTAEENAAWIRSLSVSERFAIYADMFNLVWEARQNRGAGDWEALERWNWEQKLALRLRFVEAYQKLDEYRNARAASADADPIEPVS